MAFGKNSLFLNKLNMRLENDLDYKQSMDESISEVEDILCND